MSLFKKLFGGGSASQRLFVLGLDGVGHSFVLHATRSGMMPNLAKLLKEGGLARMNSAIPTVSTVAWATYMTGVNPGKHGIFGYVDREPNPFTAYIPTARDLKTTSLWEIVGRTGKRVGIINVPLTYPPRAVNGFMVGCFLSPDLAKATYPAELAPKLLELEYRIDADMSLARGDLGAFAADCTETLARRFATGFKLMHSEPWEFFQLHVMSTDRMNHFLWGDWEDGRQGLAPEFETFYRRLDSYLGELVQHLPQGCRLVMLSDHGFCRAKANLYLNHWLEKNGYLHFARGKRELLNMHPDSKAYCLAPGRIFVNLEGREEKGHVGRGKAYEDLREELIHRLGGLTHPQTNEPLVRKVFRREELYAGPLLNRAADLIVAPANGYELKPQYDAPDLLTAPDVSGCHTHDDAFLFIAGLKHPPADNSFSLLDVAPTLLGMMGVAAPQSMEGQALC